MAVKIPERLAGESWRTYQCRLTNNMHLQFPLGAEPFRASYGGKVSFYLRNAEESGTADVSHGAYDNSPWPDDPHSELKASKTPRQFAEEILEVATSLGINVPDFCKKLNRWYLEERDFVAGINGAYDELDTEVGMAMVRIYTAMLERGYTHRDLWS